MKDGPELALRPSGHHSMNRPIWAIFVSLNFASLLLNPFGVCDSAVWWSNLFQRSITLCEKLYCLTVFENRFFSIVWLCPRVLKFLSRSKKKLYGTSDRRWTSLWNQLDFFFILMSTVHVSLFSHRLGYFSDPVSFWYIFSYWVTACPCQLDQCTYCRVVVTCILIFTL